MSAHQQSKPRRANQSMTEELGRPSTCKSKVGCDAIDEPCTKRMVPAALFGLSPYFSNMNSFTLSSLLVQCCSPRIAAAAITSSILHLFEIVVVASRAGRVGSRARRLEVVGRKLTCMPEDCDATGGHRRARCGSPCIGLPCTFLCAALRVAAFGLQRESAWFWGKSAHVRCTQDGAAPSTFPIWRVSLVCPPEGFDMSQSLAQLLLAYL